MTGRRVALSLLLAFVSFMAWCAVLGFVVVVGAVAKWVVGW